MWFKRINEIKNSEAFDSFEWKGPELKQYNLIYGWNGAGKTTSSRIYRSVENGVIAPELGTSMFQLQTDGGSIKNKDVATPATDVRVFNDDFVRDHLKFSESKTKQILIAGKASVETENEIKILVAQGKELERQKAELSTARAKIKPLEDILTAAGTAVTKQFADTPLASSDYSGRTYKRPRVEKHLADGAISASNVENLIIKKQEDIDRRREVIKSQRSKVSVTPKEIMDFLPLFSEANALLSASPHIEIIDELSADDERRKWVETGYSLHKNRKSEACLFCSKDLDAGYIDRLGRFFTQELEEVKTHIDQAVLMLDVPGYKGEINGPESGLLLPDLSIEYLSRKAETEKYSIEIRAAVGSLVKALQDKRDNLQDRAKKISTVAYPAKAVADFNLGVRKLADTITKHNEEIDKKIEATKDIELHAIAQTLKDKEYFQKKTEADALDAQLDNIDKELDRIDREVRSKRAAILNAAIAVTKINEIISEFFGEGHIYLEADTIGGELGYLLKRRGRHAKYLSEGEKSVIALAYFLTKLEEGGFNKKESVIIVDDPVDSQDELFLFKTYGLIKRRLGKSGQLILLTHNFPFFNLIRDWFVKENKTRKRERLDPVAEFYSMRCVRTAAAHNTKVESLHELLKDYKTEYQYLFYQLCRFNAGTGDIDEPLVPNIGRKVLEYFASFKWSCDVDEELAAIVQGKYIDDPSAKPEQRALGDFILKFMDEYSHGRDFTRPISASTFEAKSVATNILKLIEIADQEHYERLVSCCGG